MRKFKLFIIVITVVLFSMNSDAQILSTIEQQLYSKVLDEERTVIIQLPASYQSHPTKKYPVLYLLDGTDNIGHTAGTLGFLGKSGEVPEMVVVAIVNKDRFKDLSPSVDPKIRLKTGGGKAFLKFIEQELVTYINNNYRTEDFKILAGHSLGGLFALYALQSSPEFFQAHFAFSPSLQWNNKEIVIKINSLLAKTKRMKNFVYINLGNEKKLMREAFDDLSLILEKVDIKDFHTKVELFENETHGSTPVIGFFKAIRTLYSDWRVPLEKLRVGYEPLANHFDQLSIRFGYTIRPSEQLVNGAGYYQLYETKDLDEAIKIFNWNVRLYPLSTNPYDSLAEAFEAKGNYEKALELVNKAIKLSKKDDKRLKQYVAHKNSLIKKM